MKGAFHRSQRVKLTSSECTVVVVYDDNFMVEETLQYGNSLQCLLVGLVTLVLLCIIWVGLFSGLKHILYNN